MPGIDQIHASGVTGEGITIAVIDSVINPAFPDLGGSTLQVHEPSFCDADGDLIADPATSTTEPAAHAIPAYDDIVTAPSTPVATDSSSPVPLIIGGVLVLLAAAGTITAIILTRRKQRRTSVGRP